MVRTEQLAESAIAGDALKLRSLTQDWLWENPTVTDCAAPSSTDATVLSVAAALVELFSIRKHQAPPGWTTAIGGVPLPMFLVRAAERLPNLRRLCLTESPLPLRRRNLFAPPAFLEFV